MVSAGVSTKVANFWLRPLMLRSDYAKSVYHMSWDYHVVMTSLVLDYSTTFHMTSHSDSYYYRD
jgi:hypothetical protein